MADEDGFSDFPNWLIFGLVGRVFANGLGDRDLIPGCVITNTFKMVLDTSLLNTQLSKVLIKGKVEQSRERSRCWKGSLLVTLDYGRQLTFTYIQCEHIPILLHFMEAQS